MRKDSQTTGTVLMIRPTRFASNPQTAASNAFQRAGAETRVDAVQDVAAREFDALVATLEREGVEVLVYADTPAPDKPDAIFPNNWVSTHADGTVVLYPMHAPNRRLERRLDIVDDLAQIRGRRVGRVLDLAASEQQEVFLEGTGSLVLDRVNRVAYACLSPRTHHEAFAAWAAQLGYEAVAFDATDQEGRPIYHTNVMMCVGARLAVLCLAAIRSTAEREMVRSKLVASHHEVIDISFAQMNAFAGNMLELTDRRGRSLFVMSQRARDSLNEHQRAAIEAHSRIVSASIDTIEDCAGGSVRCMLAEVFLPRAAG